MNAETVDAIKQALVPVAAKIGQTAEWGWGVVLKQQYVEAAQNGLSILLEIALAIVVYRLTLKMWEWKKKDSWSDWELGGTILPILGAALIIPALWIDATSLIGHLINPEFYAIQFFMGLVK